MCHPTLVLFKAFAWNSPQVGDSTLGTYTVTRHRFINKKGSMAIIKAMLYAFLMNQLNRVYESVEYEQKFCILNSTCTLVVNLIMCHFLASHILIKITNKNIDQYHIKCYGVIIYGLYTDKKCSWWKTSKSVKNMIELRKTHKATPSCIYIYVYICIYTYVCVRVCVRVCVCARLCYT